MLTRLNAEGMASIFQHLLTIATEQLSVHLGKLESCERFVYSCYNQLLNVSSSW